MDIIDIPDEGCSCHTNPPCKFCESMTEGECEAWIASGQQGLRKYIEERDDVENKEVNIKYFMYRGMQMLGFEPNEDTDKEVLGWRRSKGDIVGRLIKLSKEQMHKPKAEQKKYYWVRRVITEKRKLKDVPKNFKKGQ